MIKNIQPKKRNNFWLFIIGGCFAFICFAVVVDQISLILENAGFRATRTPRPTRTERIGFLTSIMMTQTAEPTDTPQPTLTSSPIPSDTLTPTETPTPTNTIVFIPPTSASTGFDNNGDGKVTCADFQTQAAAQQAYNAGYTNLDGNDKDGRACESLP